MNHNSGSIRVSQRYFQAFWGFSWVISWERPCGSSWKTRSVFQGAVGAFCASTAPSASTGPVRGRQDGSQGGEPGVMSNWTAASSDCGRDDVHIRTADLYRPNARFTPERQRYQVLTPFGKLGYSHNSARCLVFATFFSICGPSVLNANDFSADIVIELFKSDNSPVTEGETVSGTLTGRVTIRNSLTQHAQFYKNFRVIETHDVPHPVPWTQVNATPPGVARAPRVPRSGCDTRASRDARTCCTVRRSRPRWSVRRRDFERCGRESLAP